MNKNIQTKLIEDTTDKIVVGINKVCNIITSTMGGAGKNVIIRDDENTTFTKDGVSVAKSIKLENPIENIGANLVIEASNKTVQQCGDGTTTTALFVQEFINGLKKEDVDMENVLEELDNFVEQYEKILIEQSKNIETSQDVYNIALTSSKSAHIARLINEIYIHTGSKANITLEMSRISDSTYYELSKGLNFESGMINSRFANEDNGNCVFENAYIMLEQEGVSVPQSYKEILDDFLNKDEAIVIIAPNFSDLFVRFAVTAKMNQGLKICLISSPGYGASVKENYRDIAAFSDGGYVSKIVISNYDFTIFNDPDMNQIDKRVKQLTKMAENAHEDFYERDYNERITRLTQTGAIIYVGGTTEKNAKEEYDRIEDALGAVKSAFKLGYVRGAGSELCQIAPLFGGVKEYELGLVKHEFNIVSTIKSVLKAPFKKILENANITRQVKTDIPFNVRTKQYDENIVDATDVLIQSMKNAVALVKLLINTSYTLYNEEIK